MAVFEYVAKDSTGNEFSGVYMDIDSKNALRQELQKMGYSLVKAHREKKSVTKDRRKIKQTEIIAFVYEFAGMYAAGLSIVRCLETFEMQVDNPAFKAIITDVRQRIETGASLEEAFEKYRSIFSDFFLGMVEAGEAGGKLAETLQMAAQYLEKQAELRGKIKSAFAYPVVVSVMCVAIVTALVIFVIPVFQKLYSQLHVSLPGPTLALILISRAAREFWWIALPSIAVLVFIIRKLMGSSFVRAKVDVLKLELPLFGKLNRMVAVSRFIRTFAMMASAGIPVVEAIDFAKRVANNSEMKKIAGIIQEEIMTSAGIPVVEAIDFAKRVANNSEMKKIAGIIQEEIMTGNSIAGPMSRFPIFPPMIVQLAAAGEEAGILPEMLTKGVDFLDSHIDRTINSLIMKIEPILSVGMGLLVGTILLGVYLPMFDYMSHVN